MKSWFQIWELLKVGGKQTEPLYRLAMIVNQVGSLCKCVSYKHSYGWSLVPEADVEIKISLADLLAMTYMMAFNEGISLGELQQMAQERLLEFIGTRLPK